MERLGYRRHWVAEHHNMPGIASSAPAVLIAHLASVTSTIRVGSGGVMLPNHQPLVVAEQFGMLEALHPGRIDLGIGRAPGTDQVTAYALRRSMDPSADDLPVLLEELRAFFTGTFPRITAVPGAGDMPEIWLLGSSDFSARLAAELGLPFSFAHHFMPQNTVPALEIYRRHFTPSATLAEPYAMVGVAVVCAETDEQARWLHGPAKLSFLRLRTVSLSYGLPNSLLRRGNFTGARLYVTGANLFTVTDYSGFDPDVSLDEARDLLRIHGHLCGSAGGVGRFPTACRMGRAEIGQDLYTPATSKTNPVPAPGSRPNAGWLYLSQTARSLRVSRSDELTLTFGVTGRPSLGKFTQTIAHNAAPTFNRPSDWSDQVGFEPGLAARYEQRRRIGQDDRAIGFDVIPRFALTAGNVSTAAEIGVQTRTGWHLRHPWLPRDGPLEIALIGGVSARAVARDLFLDGNTFRDGPHVGHEVFVGSGEIGVLIRFRALSLAYRAVNDTRSYAAGPKWHPWASIVGGVTFGH